LGGVKGASSLRDRTAVLAISSMIMGSTVLTLKYLTNIERPDGSRRNSFPSAHSATVFMGAEFLYQEYKNVSIWYGIGGYVLATGTGLLRMYNNRHWFTDVCAGAGIGILSTKLAYWIYPSIAHKIFKRETCSEPKIVPFYDGKQIGIDLAIEF
jgi:membrane-associated phospholipid phosphatase